MSQLEVEQAGNGSQEQTQAAALQEKDVLQDVAELPHAAENEPSPEESVAAAAAQQSVQQVREELPAQPTSTGPMSCLKS